MPTILSPIEGLQYPTERLRSNVLRRAAPGSTATVGRRPARHRPPPPERAAFISDERTSASPNSTTRPSAWAPRCSAWG